MIEIKTDLTKVNFNKATNKLNKFIVVHYTANSGDTAAGNCNYFRDTNRNASANYFVDKDGAYLCVYPWDVAWHCGKDFSKGKAPFWNVCTNANSIGIEMCDSLKRNEAVENNTIELIINLMLEYNIPIYNVIRHYDVCGKECPKSLLDDKAWADFKYELARAFVKRKGNFDEECTMKYLDKHPYSASLYEKLCNF